MTDALTPLLTLWEMVQADDEDVARDLRRRARDEGAPALLIARAVRIRDQRIAAQVQVIHAGGSRS